MFRTQPDRSQQPPVRVYEIEDRVMVAAPLPGLEPGDIEVSVDGTRVIVSGDERGPNQHERPVTVAEWTIGPYRRELTLATPVSGALANATYDNGVLVLALPKASTRVPAIPATFRLGPVERPTHGERIGHSGSSVAPLSDAEHRRQRHASRRGG
jgi:HSP20 family protein